MIGTDYPKMLWMLVASVYLSTRLINGLWEMDIKSTVCLHSASTLTVTVTCEHFVLMDVWSARCLYGIMTTTVETMQPTLFVLLWTDDDLLRRLDGGGAEGKQRATRRRAATTGSMRPVIVARCALVVVVVQFVVVDIISTADRWTTYDGCRQRTRLRSLSSAAEAPGVLHRRRDDVMSSTSRQLFDVVVCCGRHDADDVNCSCVVRFTVARGRNTRSVKVNRGHFSSRDV